MNILNRDIVKDYMIKDLEMLLACSNLDTYRFCKGVGWDILRFIEEIDYEN